MIFVCRWQAADYDSITQVWTHVLLTVTNNRLKLYIDGEVAIAPIQCSSQFSDGTSNIACKGNAKFSGNLSPEFSGSFGLNKQIFVGIRSDLAAGTWFRGHLALLQVSWRLGGVGALMWIQRY